MTYHNFVRPHEALKRYSTKKYGPSEIKFFFDMQVSYRGKLANLTEEIISFQGIKWEAILSKIVDFEIIKISRAKNGIVATSNGVIIKPLAQ